MEGKVFYHVALTVTDLSEIQNFYIDILGLEPIKKFTLSKEISARIFNIEKETEVNVVGKNDFSMEIFHSDKPGYRDYQHVCIAVPDRESVIQKAKENNYQCIIIKRDISDLVFIIDRSGNSFEIKEIAASK
jgi:catechol 2,3-dioxygenase-like lactoylglutathione lyase family enzyme